MSEPQPSEPVTDPARAFRPAAPQAGTGYVDDDFSTYPEVDFGPLRVPVPPDAGVRMSVEDARYADAVFFDFPNGSIRLSVLAAPRTGGLWPDRAEEIARIQAGIGAQVSSVWGEWGRELHIVHEGEYNWVIGVDGSRSMLLGRATWDDESGWGLVDTMRTMIRHSRVERGDEPMPVRTPLPLRRPGSAAEQEAPDDPAGYAAVVTMLTPPPPELPEVDEASDEPPWARPSATEPPDARLDPVGRVEPRGARVETPTRISTRRGALVAAAAVLVVAGCLWITQEDAVSVQAAQPEPAAGPVRPPAGADRPELLGAQGPAPAEVPTEVPAEVPAPAAPVPWGPVPAEVPSPAIPARPPVLPGAGPMPTAPAPDRADPGAAPIAGGGKRTVDRSGATNGGRAERGPDSDPARTRASVRSDSAEKSRKADSSERPDSSGRSDSSDRSESSDSRDSSDSSDSKDSSDERDRSRIARQPGGPGGSGFGPADALGGGYPFGPGEPFEPVAGLTGGVLGGVPGL